MKVKIILGTILIFITFFSSVYFSKIFFDTLTKKNMKDFYDKVNLDKNSVFYSNTIKIDGEVQKKQEKDELFSIKLSFAGDTMLASYKDQTTPGSFNDYVNKNDSTYFLDNVRNIFEEDDFTILNLENALTDRDLPEVIKSSNPAYWYKSKTSNINILSSSSVEGVSVSNNHTGDYGDVGKQDTIDTIVNANMQYGDYNNIMYFEKNNFVVAVICKGLWIESQAYEIINLIKESEKKSDYQIVFFHGGAERIHQPEEWKRRATRKLVDNGADLVVGSHPHVLQPREVYNNKEIVYSLGNFCYGGNMAPENRTIIYQINLKIDADLKVINEESNIIPCYVYTGKINNYQPTPIMEERIKDRVMDFMNWKVDTPF